MRIGTVSAPFSKNASDLLARSIANPPQNTIPAMYQDATDLFGEVVVTEDDLFNWVAAVAPRWLAPERAYRNYLRSWDVAGKVRHAKLVRTFDATVDNKKTPWHGRFALDQIV